MDSIEYFERDNNIREYNCVHIYQVIEILYLYCYYSLFHLNHLMVRGDLDYFLLKPVHSQFMVSFRYVRSHAIISLIILCSLLIVQILSYSEPISLTNYLVFSVSFILGTVLWYCVDLIIFSTCFWAKNFSVGGWLSHEILKFSLRPDSIYTGLMRKILFSFIPMVFIASIPTRNLLYGPNFRYLGLQFFVTLGLFLISRLVWKRGLLRYESASS